MNELYQLDGVCQAPYDLWLDETALELEEIAKKNYTDIHRHTQSDRQREGQRNLKRLGLYIVKLHASVLDNGWL